MSVRVERLTPPGRAGVACLRVSGPHAAPFVRDACAPGLAVDRRAPQLVRLLADGELLDEGLACVHADDCVELHPHGSPPVVRRLLELFARAGAHVGPARDGERSLEDEARHRLASAETEAAARVLLDQEQGALRRALEEITELVERERSPSSHGRSEVDRRLDELLEAGRVARFLFHPAHVVLAGPTNAGKSTLFNALVGEERVLVSDAAGTTRDVVRAPARLGAYPVRLADTAGERELAAEDAAAALEALGQGLARDARRGADLCLWLSPADAPVAPPPELEGLAVALVSRADLDRPAAGPPEPRGPGARFGARDDPEGARRTVERLFRTRFALPERPHRPGRAVPFTAAQLSLLLRARCAAGAPRRAALRGVAGVVRAAGID